MAEKLYLFKGDQYIQCDVASKTVDAGFPHRIIDDWPGLAFKDWGGGTPFSLDRNFTDANYHNGVVCFYVKNGNDLWYANYDLDNDAVSIGLVSVAYGSNVPIEFINNLSATRYLNDDLYLFSGDSFMYRKGGTGPYFGSDITLNTVGMTRLPAGYTSDFDSVVELEGNNTMFFKGRDCFVYPGAPQPISSVWVGTDKVGFDSDIQAAIVLPAEKSSYLGTNS